MGQREGGREGEEGFVIKEERKKEEKEENSIRTA